MSTANPKPSVSVATACEKVMTEKDDVLSLIRIVDTFYIPDQAAGIPSAGIPINTLIVLRGGDFIGEGELSIVIDTPDGVRNEVPDKVPMIFKSADQGANVIGTMIVALRHIGVSWVNVLWNGELLTKFPIKLQHEKARKISGTS